MPIYSESFAAAFGLLASSDRDLMEILALSINVSLASLVLSCMIGLPDWRISGHASFPDARFSGWCFQCPDGIATGCCGAVGLFAFVEIRAIWLARAAIYAAGHGDCTDDFDHTDYHRAILSGS